MCHLRTNRQVASQADSTARYRASSCFRSGRPKDGVFNVIFVIIMDVMHVDIGCAGGRRPCTMGHGAEWANTQLKARTPDREIEETHNYAHTIARRGDC